MIAFEGVDGVSGNRLIVGAEGTASVVSGNRFLVGAEGNSSRSNSRESDDFEGSNACKTEFALNTGVWGGVKALY